MKDRRQQKKRKKSAQWKKRKDGTKYLDRRHPTKSHIEDEFGYLRYADSGKLVHVWIAERYVLYNQKLLPDEMVHHINWNKHDNRAENLRVMKKKEFKNLVRASGRDFRTPEFPKEGVPREDFQVGIKTITCLILIFVWFVLFVM